MNTVLASPIVLRRSLATSTKAQIYDKFFQPFIDSSKPVKHKIDLLEKPVGLPETPQPDTTYSHGNSFRDLFDKDKTQSRTKQLTLEYNRSGMYEAYTFRHTGGKMFHSPMKLWDRDKSLYFPHLVGKSIAKGQRKPIVIEKEMEGKINIVRLFGSSSGEKLTQQFFTGKNSLDNWTLCDSQHLQMIEINWLENKLKYWINKLSILNVRKTIPRSRHRLYFNCLREQLPFRERELLNINNLYAGFIMLVDDQLKIRWMASGGIVSVEERDKLWENVKLLQKELIKK